MAKTLLQKQDELNVLAEKMPKAQSMVFVDYTGITVEEATTLRKQARAEGTEYIVAKKTLMKKAAEQSGITLDLATLSGNVGVLLGYQDVVAPARIANNFAKTSEHLKILLGVMDKNILAKATVMQLATLPSKQELYQMLVGTLSAPIASFARVISRIAEKSEVK